MEALNGLVTLLGNGFFPIAVCAVLFWYVNKKDISHKAEIDELRKSIDNNTLILEKLVTTLDNFDRKENSKNAVNN